MKSRDVIFVAVLFVVIGTFTTIVFRRPADPIRYENFEHIQVGMTRHEVGELLGCGPCVYKDGVTYVSLCNYKGPDPCGTWDGERALIQVTFVDGRVAHKSFEEKPIPSDTWRAWLSHRLSIR